MLGVFGMTLALAVVGYVFIPKGFFPVQDTGFVLGTTEAAADMSYPDMVEKHLALAKIVGDDPAVQAFSHSVGVTGSNQTIANGRFWISLKTAAIAMSRPASSSTACGPTGEGARHRPVPARRPGHQPQLRPEPRPVPIRAQEQRRRGAEPGPSA
jgi:multidrug efflux pump subunit AcrB